MEQNKDQSGAAVRGEAVALTDADIVEIARVAHADGRLSWIGFDKDDIGEHTVPILSKCHFQLVRAVLAKVSARAADAPSELATLIEPIFTSWDGCDFDGIDIGAALRADFKTFVFGKCRAADAPPEPSDDPMPTEISMLLRRRASGPMENQDDAKLMLTAADECERFYGGMVAWKKTAQKKDRDWRAERMERCNDRIKSRAADAPYEPSKLLTMAQVNAIRDTIKPGDGWDGDNWDFALANAVAAKLKSCAADALDSQPTESASDKNVSLEQACRNLLAYVGRNPPTGESLWCIRQIRNALLSDQATGLPTFHATHVENIELALAQELDEAELNANDYVTVNRAKLRSIAERILAAAKLELSSQPTDGRCAECGLHCKAGACIYGQPTDGGVRNG